MKKFPKQLLTIIMAVMMVVMSLPATAFAATNAGSFTDVNSDDFYYDPVKWAIEKKVTSGTSATTFSPKDECTRGQIVTFLYKAGNESPVPNAKTFSDVNKSKYYYDPVGWAVANNITVGTTSTTFSPNKSCTRAQAVTFLWRFAGSPKAESSKFNDVKEGKYYYSAVAWAVSRGITAGTSSTEFSPNQTCTRAQIVTFLYKHFNSQNNQSYSSSDKNVTITFNSNGGTAVESQSVKSGSLVQKPNDPTNGTKMFTWWFTDKDLKKAFNFDEDKVNSNITLYAGWIDFDDAKDSDSDGIIDSVEKAMGTNAFSNDSDSDGLPDNFEITYGFDPQKADSIETGKKDGDVDSDEDGLTNVQEYQFSTNPLFADTDDDELTDGAEVSTHHTDPLKADTDGDGAEDGYEVSVGTDPNQYDPVFNVDVSAPGNDGIKSAEIIMSADGVQAESVKVYQTINEDIMNKEVPGYIGMPYDFDASDTENLDATLRFYFDPAGLPVDAIPTIYYFNPESSEYESLETTVDMTNGVATAHTDHFSTYVLLNKRAFDSVWNSDIKMPTTTDPSSARGLSVAFVVDYSASMNWNDPNGLRLDLTKEFISRLTEKDLGCLVTFIADAQVVTPLTDDTKALIAGVNSIENDDDDNYNSGTNGSAGLNLAIDELGKDTSGNRRCVIFLTDGIDTEVSYDYDDIASKAKKQHILLYTIGLGDVDDYILRNIAKTTGGRYYYATQAGDLNDAYEQAEKDTLQEIFVDENNDGLSDQYVEWLTRQGFIVNGTVNPFYKKSYADIQKNNDYDQDGLKNGDEMSIVPGENGYRRIIVKSDPTRKDTDNDGLLDNEVRYYKGNAIAPKDSQPRVPAKPAGLWKWHVSSIENEGKNNTDPLKPVGSSYKDWWTTMKDKLPKGENWDEFSHMIEKVDWRTIMKDKLPKGGNWDEFGHMIEKVSSVIQDHLNQKALMDKNSSDYKVLHSSVLLVKDISTCWPAQWGEELGWSADTISGLQAAGGGLFLNFVPDEDETALHSRPETWQKTFGYTELYDTVFYVGSNMNRRYIDFIVDGTMYRIWQWKGDYWNLHSGAETGLYVKNDSLTNKWGASDTPMFDAIGSNKKMSLDLYNYNYSTMTPTDILFHWMPQEKQWWATGFNWRYMTPSPEEMVSISSIDLSNDIDLYNAIKNNGIRVKEEQKDAKVIDKTSQKEKMFSFDDETHTIWITWYSQTR